MMIITITITIAIAINVVLASGARTCDLERLEPTLSGAVCAVGAVDDGQIDRCGGRGGMAGAVVAVSGMSRVSTV